jgi:hypothetical protein
MNDARWQYSQRIARKNGRVIQWRPLLRSHYGRRGATPSRCI